MIDIAVPLIYFKECGNGMYTVDIFGIMVFIGRRHMTSGLPPGYRLGWGLK